MTEALVPVHELLRDIADRLERQVRPHVDAEVFAVVVDSIDILDALARLGVTDPAQLVPRPEHTDVPAYCAEASCQNLATGPSDLCLKHLIELAIERRTLIR